MNLYDLPEFKSRLSVRILKKNTIFRFPEMQKKYVYFLKEGFIKIAVMNEEGKEVIKYLVKPGDFFGEITLLDEFENPEDYAVALEDATVHLVAAEKMKQWMNMHHDMRRAVNKHFCNRIRKIENRLLSIIFKNAKTRVSEFLADFVVEFGKKTDKGFEVKNILTHADLANLTATSRQTVSSTLNELRDKKLIGYNPRTITIPFSSALLKHEKSAM
jgi:CRP/FNR family cyclic AMP-dependent transcriptional regulator